MTEALSSTETTWDLRCITAPTRYGANGRPFRLTCFTGKDYCLLTLWHKSCISATYCCFIRLTVLKLLYQFIAHKRSSELHQQ